MAKVYVPNDVGHFLEDAKRFGEIVYLSKGRINIFRTFDITRILKKKLRDFGEDDYILISGAPVVNIICVCIALQKVKKVNILIWHLKASEYVPRTIESSALKIPKEESDE